jgi:putative membrane protein
MDEELNAPEQFILCNNDKCSTVFKYLDLSVHTVVDGPDPRDHLANERNLLTWIRTGTTLSLVGKLVSLFVNNNPNNPSFLLLLKDS